MRGPIERVALLTRLVRCFVGEACVPYTLPLRTEVEAQDLRSGPLRLHVQKAALKVALNHHGAQIGLKGVHGCFLIDDVSNQIVHRPRPLSPRGFNPRSHALNQGFLNHPLATELWRLGIRDVVRRNRHPIRGGSHA